MLRLFRYYLLMTARDCKRVSGARAFGEERWFRCLPSSGDYALTPILNALRHPPTIDHTTLGLWGELCSLPILMHLRHPLRPSNHRTSDNVKEDGFGTTGVTVPGFMRS